MKKLRPGEALVKKCVVLARQAGLSNPLGRALVASSKFYNHMLPELFYSYPDGDYRTAKDIKRQELEVVDRMRRVRPSTAKRWADHWKKGGSIRALRYTDSSYRHMIRKNREALRVNLSVNRQRQLLIEEEVGIE